MSYRKNPSDCQTAFEELYRNSPLPPVVRSLYHSQLISPRPIHPALSSPPGPKVHIFESLKNASHVQSNNIPDDEQTSYSDVTQAAENVQDTPKENVDPQIKDQVDTRPGVSAQTVANSLSPEPPTISGSAMEENEEESFVDNFFTKKQPPVSHENQRADDGHLSDESLELESVEESKTSSVSRLGSDRPTKLYNWIIRPYPQLKGIRLDGQRDQTLDEFWLTGWVTTRLSGKTVGTQNGSSYHIVGNMDLYEAVEAGVPQDVAVKFKKGFPTDWKEVLDEFFSSITENESVSSEEEKSVDTELVTDGGKMTRLKSSSVERQHDVYHLYSHDSNEETATNAKAKNTQKNRSSGSSKVHKSGDFTSSGDSTLKHVSESEVARNTFSSSDDIFKPRKETKGKMPTKQVVKSGNRGTKLKKADVMNSAESTEEDVCGEEFSQNGNVSVSGEEESTDDIVQPKVIKLSRWIINLIQNGVCVEGQKSNEGDFWHSSRITKRLSLRRVATKSGSVYHLIGDIQKQDALEAGIPEPVVKAFSKGFPANWKKVLSKHCFDSASTSSRSERDTTSANTITPAGSPKQKTRKHLRSQHEENATNGIDLDNSLCTPNGQMVDLNNLPTTRSGRRVMPQLAWWMGQHCSFDVRGNIIEVSSGTPAAVSFMKESYRDLQSRSTHLRRYAMKTKSAAATSKTESPNLETKVMDVLSRRKTERLSRKSSSHRQTCYSQDSEGSGRRLSKLDMRAVVPVTVLRNGTKKAVDTSDLSDSSASKMKRRLFHKAGRKNPVNSRKGDSQEDSCSTDSQTDEETSSRASKARERENTKSKTSSRVQNNVTRNMKRKSNQSASDSETENKKPRRLRTRTHNKTYAEYKSNSLNETDDTSERKSKRGTRTKIVGRNDRRNRDHSPSDSEPEIRKPRRGKHRKKNSIYSEDETESTGETTDASETKRGRRTKKNKKQPVPNDWGKSEVLRLYKAIQRTRDDHPQYWDVVAECVETRSSEECQLYYETSAKVKKQSARQPSVKPKETKEKKGRKKKGKSKKDESDDDDFFKATPFRPSVNKKTKTFNLTADETTTFEEKCVLTPGALHKTPVIKDLQTLRLEQAFNKSRLERDTNVKQRTEIQAKPAANPKQHKKKLSSGIPGVTAGKGTLKRKEQLREIYNQHNQAEDDIFDATPSRGGFSKKPTVQKFTLTEDEDLEFESGCIPTPGSRHRTPIVRDGARFLHKTPNTDAKIITTPWINPLNRKTTDQVIAQNQKKKGRGKPKQIGTPVGSTKSTLTKSLFNSTPALGNLFEEGEDMEEIEEEDKDYYWSDED